MQKESYDKLKTVFFFGSLIAIALLLLVVLEPFFGVIAIAAILATVLYPLQQKLVKFFSGNRGLAACLVIVLTLILVFIPLSFIGRQIFNETSAVYEYLQSSSLGLPQLPPTIQYYVDTLAPNLNLGVEQALTAVAGWLAANLRHIFSGAVEVLFGFLLTLVALYFFLKDGRQFIDWLVQFSPLDDKYDNLIISRLHQTIKAVVIGTIAVSLAQGVLVSLGFVVFGIPNVMLWGSLAAFAALLPGFGTALVTFPAVLFLFFTGNIFGATGLAIWSIVLVGLIDNFLLPYFYSRGDHVHPLLILFTVLGGLAVLGPLGFLLGPIVLSAFLALVQIYQIMINPKTQ